MFKFYERFFHGFLVQCFLYNALLDYMHADDMEGISNIFDLNRIIPGPIEYE